MSFFSFCLQNRYFNCDVNLQLTTRSCGTSASGVFFNDVTRRCEQGVAPNSCPS